MGESAARRTAVVTGAAQGLGEAIARDLHAHGFAVALVDVQQARVDEVAASLDPTGETASARCVDVGEREAMRELFEATITSRGGVDLLVNNAALNIARPFFEITTEEWDHVMQVNLRGALLGCQIAGAHMRDRGSGRIVNMSSLAGHIGSRFAGAHYAVSKAGLIGLTKVAAKELAPHGVTVNAVAPAFIESPLMDALPEERYRSALAGVPVGRPGRAQEVAAVVRFLASSEAAYITGATFDVNGGQFMR